MQTAEYVLSILRKKSTNDINYQFDRLYRNLFNEDFYLSAYNKIYAKEGNLTAGVDNETIDGFNLKQVKAIIEVIRGEQYYPNPVLRVHIPKKDGKTRPLGIPTFGDKLVQEAIRQILEAIYEPIFLNTSHGFRPKRSCHTALSQVKTTCRGTNWVIEGDIKGFYDNIDHDIMIKLLGKRIIDGRFLEMIKRFLKSGYFEFGQVHNTLSGAPQGGIVSPILANIYLHELDEYMEKISKEYSTSNIRRGNPAYQRLNEARYRANKNGKYQKAYELLQEMRQLPRQDPMDENYIKVKYTRYADDFLVCIIGSKEIAKNIRQRISAYLKQELKLELNLDKTIITNLGENRVRFLGYEIAKTRDNTVITENTLGIKRRSANETIQLLVPQDIINEKIKPFMRNGKSMHCGARINLPINEIIRQFNSEIRGLYNYYILATDVSTKIGRFRHYHYTSLAKTIARKEKSSVKKVIDKYGVEVKLKQGTGTRKIIGVTYNTKDGAKTMTYFNKSLSKRNEPSRLADSITLQDSRRHQILDRISANICELCSKTSTDGTEFEVHHVRKLKSIRKEYFRDGATNVPNWVKVMSKMNRKTLVVCQTCHTDIHSES
jgi:group II intron reverse transcriptase/maturase